KSVRSGSSQFTLSRSRMRSRTGVAPLVENEACGIAKYPRLRLHRHEARMTPAKRCRHPLPPQIQPQPHLRSFRLGVCGPDTRRKPGGLQPVSVAGAYFVFLRLIAYKFYCDRTPAGIRI